MSRALALIPILVASLGAVSLPAQPSRTGTPGTAAQHDVVSFLEIARTAERVSESIEGAAGGGGGGAPPSEGEVVLAAQPGVSPLPSASFPGVMDDRTRFVPNTQGAVGADHLMLAVSTTVQVQNRSGAVLASTPLDAFWASQGNPAVLEPRLLYDPLGPRWVFAAMANPYPDEPGAGVLIAVSQTTDPTGLWNRYFLPLNTTNQLSNPTNAVFARSPNLGFNVDWIALTVNTYDFAEGNYKGPEIFVFDKADLYAGGSGRHARFRNLPIIGRGGPQNIPVPAATYNSDLTTLYLMANWDNDADGAGFLRIMTVSGPINAPVFNLGSFVGQTRSIPGWDDYAPNDADFAPQLGSANKIYLGDARLQNVVYRNSTLWTAQTIFLPLGAPTYTAVQWFEVTPGGNTFQHGGVQNPDEQVCYAFPCISVNRNNDVVIGYNRFSPNQYPSANYAFRADADIFDRLRSDTILKPGEAPYFASDDGINRWGEWSSVVLDPINDTEFWLAQEYAATRDQGVDRWGTWWGRVSPAVEVSLAATAAPEPVAAGLELTYSLTVSNAHPSLGRVASGLKIVDPLPLGAVFVSASASQGSCSFSNGVVTCELGQLISQTFASATIVIRPRTSGSLTNVISVSANGPDLNPADNTAVVVSRVNPSSDLGVFGLATPSLVNAGELLTFEVNVSNLGPSQSSGVTVTNLLPAGVDVVQVSTTQGNCTRSGSLVTCNLGNMPDQSNVRIDLVVRPSAPGSLTNRATVSASSPPDANPANNSLQIIAVVNQPPTILPIPSQVTDEDRAIAIPVTVGDVETPPDQLLVRGASSSQQLVPDANIAVQGTGATRTMTILPLTNQFGNVQITVRVLDAAGSSRETNFTLTVRPVNDAPTISDVADQVTSEDIPKGPINIVLSDVDSPSGSLFLSAASSNPALLPPNRVDFNGSGTLRTMILRPATNQFGSALMTISVSDGSATSSDQFNLTVLPENDPPVVSPVADQVVDEDASTPPIAFRVQDAETLPEDLVVSAFSDKPDLLPDWAIRMQGTGTDRTLTLTLLPNAFGTTTVTIQARDESQATRWTTFLLTINGINDPPTLDPLSEVEIDEGAPPQTITLTGISAGATNENQTLLVTAVSSDPGLIPSPTVIYTNGEATARLTFAPAPGSNGVATITVRVDDGGATSNRVDQSFTVIVTSVNEAPYISAIDLQQVDEDQANPPIPFAIGDSETPAALLSVSVSSDDAVLVPPGNIILEGSGTNWSVTITPAPDKFGTALITITVSDGLARGVADFFFVVKPVNDPPSLGLPPDLTMEEDQSARPITFTVSDPDDPATNLVVTVSSTNAVLVPASQIALGGNDGDRTIIFQPAQNQAGATRMVLQVKDPSGDTVEGSFGLTVVPVNDPPTLDQPGAVAVDEGSGPHVVNLAGISSGAPNEIQALRVSATSSHPTLIPDPTVEYLSPQATGRLTFTPSPDAFGDVTLFVRVEDGGRSNNIVQKELLVHVRPVNDLPTIAPISGQVIDEDTQTLPLAFTIRDTETPADQLLLSAFSVMEDVVSSDGIIFGGSGTNRTLTVRPLPNQSGPATLAVIVEDADGGTALAVVEVMVNPVNDPPTVSALSGFSMHEERRTAVVPFTVADVESSPGSLIPSASSSNPALLPDANLVFGGSGPTRTLTVTVRPGVTGQSVVTLRVRDPEGATTIRTFDVNYLVGPVLRIVRTGPSAILSWSTNHPNYVVQWRDGMAGGDAWQLMRVPPDIQGERYQVTVPADDSLRFYRLFEVPPPTVTDISNQSTPEDGVLERVTFSVAGHTFPGEALTVESGSSNPTLVPPQNLVLSGTGPDRSLAITPVADRSGTATISVTVRDSLGRSVRKSFELNVASVNDQPTFEAGPPQSSLEDSGAQTIPAWASGIVAGPAEEAGQTLTFTLENDNASLFAAPPTISPTGALTFTPRPNVFGTARVTVRLQDNGGTANGGQDTSAPRTLTIDVLPVNDPPSFVGGAGPSVLEDAGAQTMAGWAAAVSPGPPEEAAQALNFVVTNDRTSLFAVQPAVSLDGALSYTPASNASGMANVSVRLVDDGGTANGGQSSSPVVNITITVTAVNDPPSFTPAGDLGLPEDAGPQTMPGWASGVNAGAPDESGQTLHWEISTSTNALFAVPPAIGLDGTLTFAPVPNGQGVATVSVQLVDDGGTANGGQDRSPERTFKIILLPVNDPPTFLAGSNVTLLEDSLAQTVPGWATGINAGPNDEAGQSLSFQVETDAPGLFSVAPAVASDGRLTFTPAPDAVGAANVTVRLHDDGGTERGGQDTSQTANFTLTLTPVNDPPVFTPGPDVALAEDAGPQSLAWATGVLAGPPNEFGQGLSFVLSGDGQTFLASPPQISPDGTLAFTPAPNQSGSATYTVGLRDDGGTANGGHDSSALSGFTISVAPVNDPPTLGPIEGRSIPENSGPQVVALTGIGSGAPDEVQALVVTASSSDRSRIPDPQVIHASPDSTGSLSFTPLANANGTVTISVSVSDDGSSNNVTVRTFDVVIRPPNHPPTISAIPDQTIAEDTATAPIPFVIGDVETPLPSLMLSAHSSNPLLLPSGNLVFSGSGSNRTLVATPLPNAFGSSVVAITVSDGELVKSSTFVLRVNPVNDLPTIGNIPNLQTAEDTPLTVPFVVSDPDMDPFSLLLTANSSNTNLLANTNIWFEGSGTNRTLTLVPSPDLFGSTTLSVAVSDGVRSTNDTFVLTVAAVNDPPTLDPIPDQLTRVGGAEVNVNLSGIGRGGTNELTGTIVLSATSSNTAMIAIRGRSYASPNPTGIQKIRGELAGVAPVTITVDDSQATNHLFSRSFLAYATPAGNVLPTLSGVTDRVIAEDTSTGPIPFTVGDAETPPGSLAVAAWSTNPALFPPANIVLAGTDANRTVTVSPASNRTGTGRIYLRVVDGTFGMTNTSFMVTVNALNDLPVVSEIADQTIQPNAATGVIPFTVFDTETPATHLRVTAASSNPTLVPVSSIVLGGGGTTRALQVTPAADQSGTASITLTVTDAAGGTAIEAFLLIVALPTQTELRWQRLAPNTLRLLWPDTAAGYRLQQRAGLNPNQAWGDVVTPPVLIGSEYAVDVSTLEPARFYRLILQP